MTAPAKVSLLGPGAARVTIHEGRNRQVRRMCEAVGHPVRRLVRTRIGPVSDPELAPGGWRQLTPARSGSCGRRPAARGRPGPGRGHLGAAPLARPSEACRSPRAPRPGPAVVAAPSAVTIVACACLTPGPHFPPSDRPGEVAKPVFTPAPGPATCRALRGATTVDEDDYSQVTTRTMALVRAMVEQQWPRPPGHHLHTVHGHRRHPLHVPGHGRPPGRLR